MIPRGRTSGRSESPILETPVGCAPAFLVETEQAIVLQILFYKSAIKRIKGTEAQGMTVTREALDSICEGLYRVTQSTWWEWRVGTTPFFCRRTEEFQDRIRDGIKLWISGRLTPYRRAQ
jgi:hypothetical protein